jgi:hypothetical protein
MMSGSKGFLVGGDIRGFVESAQVLEDLVASNAARRAAIRPLAADMSNMSPPVVKMRLLAI